MQPVNLFNQASGQIATHPVSILRYRGNFNGTTNARWLMLFNSVIPAVNGAVPMVPAIPLNQTSPFFSEFEIGPLEFSLGCWVAVSTTQETLTLSADTMDFSAELSDNELPTGTTFVGDLLTPVTGLQVWTEAAGLAARKRLMSLEVDGTLLTGAQQFIQIFAADTDNAGAIPPPVNTFPINAGQVLTGGNGKRFGGIGLEVYANDTLTTPGTGIPRLGCTIKISSTPNTYTACNGTACIRAEYK